MRFILLLGAGDPLAVLLVIDSPSGLHAVRRLPPADSFVPLFSCVAKRNWSPIGHCSPPHTPAGCADGFLPVPDDMPESSPHSMNEVQLWRKENAKNT